MDYQNCCPFCGCEETVLDASADNLSYWIRCKVCGATGPATASAHLAHSKWFERREVISREKPIRGSYARKRATVFDM